MRACVWNCATHSSQRKTFAIFYLETFLFRNCFWRVIDICKHTNTQTHTHTLTHTHKREKAVCRTQKKQTNEGQPKSGLRAAIASGLSVCVFVLLLLALLYKCVCFWTWAHTKIQHHKTHTQTHNADKQIDWSNFQSKKTASTHKFNWQFDFCFLKNGNLAVCCSLLLFVCVCVLRPVDLENSWKQRKLKKKKIFCTKKKTRFETRA